MTSFKIDTSQFDAYIARVKPKVQAAAVATMHEATDDLERIAVNIAPIDSGQLRRSSKKTVIPVGNAAVIGTVSFNATENSPGYGRFNYALWTHEYQYNLGQRSAASPGMDGYNVGNKYLSRPLYGEASKYFTWWLAATNKALE